MKVPFKKVGRRQRAFTLVELLTVLAIIVILTSLVVSVGGYVQKKSALSRAAGEISMLVTACESYKSDNGNFPRDTTNAKSTDAISPKADFVPTSDVKGKYAASSLFLYKELSGDKTGSAGHFSNPPVTKNACRHLSSKAAAGT